MASLLIRRRSGCFIDAALLAARRLASLGAAAVDAPPPPPYIAPFAGAGESAADPPLPPAPPPRPPYIAPFARAGVPAVAPPPPPPPPPYIAPFARTALFPISRGVAAMGRSIAAPPGLWCLRSPAGACRHHCSRPSKPPQGPQVKKNKLPAQYHPAKKANLSPQHPQARAKKAKLSQQHQQAQAKKAKPSAGEQENDRNMKKWKRFNKKPKTRLQPLRRTPVWRPALYGPKLHIPATHPQNLKLDLAAKGVDCFGEADLYPKFDAVAFLKCNPMLTVQEVPGSASRDHEFSLVPDDTKYLIRSLPMLLAMLHVAGYCIKEDYTLDAACCHATLVPCTPEGMDHNYSRAAKLIEDMFLISCGQSVLPLIPFEMKNYLKVLQLGGHSCLYLILTHVALLPMSSRSIALRKFHDEILEVLPREGLEDIKDKILSAIDITSWDTIAEANKHLSCWYRYRGKNKAVGRPYDPKKPSHFLSLQRNVISHRNMKTVFEEGVIDVVLYGCYPVQLCQMQEELWKYDRLSHLHLEEDFNDGCAHLTVSMARCCAPWNAQEHAVLKSQGFAGVDASMLRILEVELPSAKVVLELAALQGFAKDKQTTAILIASKLVQGGIDCLREKVDSTIIFNSYRLAMREACKFVKEKLSIQVDKLSDEALVRCAKKFLQSKLISSGVDIVAILVVEAVQAVKTTNANGVVKYPLKDVNILKVQNKCIQNSYLLKGCALNIGRASQGMPASVKPARIACLDFSLQKMRSSVRVPDSDPSKCKQRESIIRKQRIEKILKAGANVVLTTKGIDDISLKHFVEAGAIAVRRVPKGDLHHVSKATGAAMVTFAEMESEETFDPSLLGHADEVVEERIADNDAILVKGTKNSSKVFIVLGVSDFMLGEEDQHLYDALGRVKETLDTNMVVAGGGAVEAALSVHLEKFASSLGLHEQLAVTEYAKSLLIIPKVLCAQAVKDATVSVNACKDATELLSMLKAYHHTSQTKADKQHFSSMGIDPFEGMVCDSIDRGVLEPARTKLKIIQFATEAAIAILQIEDVIHLTKEDSGEDDE